VFHEDEIVATAFTGAVLSFDIKRGGLLRMASPGPAAVSSFFLPVLSHDARTLAFSNDAQLSLWDVATQGTRALLVGHDADILRAAFSPDDRLLVTGSVDRSARLWDAKTGVLLRTLVGHTHFLWFVGFIRGGASVVTAGEDRTIRVWDTASGKEERVLTGHELAVLTVDSDASGQRLVSGGQDGVINLWDLRTGSRRRLAHRPKSRVMAVTWHGDKVGSGWSDGSVRVYDVASGAEQVLSGHRGEVESVRFSKDGVRLVSASGADGVRVWEIATGRPLWKGPTAHTDPSLLTRDGARVSGFPDGRIEITPTTSLPPPSSSAVTLLVEGPAQTLIAGYANGTIAVWGMENGALLYRAAMHGSVARATTSGEELTLESEIGDKLLLPLHVLQAPYCTLLREIAVPDTAAGGGCD
jgi:WD40 repeat protein